MRGLRFFLLMGAAVINLLLGAQAAHAADVVFEPGTDRAIRIDNLEVGSTMYTVTFDVQATAESVYGPFTGTYTFTQEADAAEARDAIIAALNTADALWIGESGNDFDGESFNVGFEGLVLLDVRFVNTARSVIEGDEWINLGLNTWTYNLDEKNYAIFSGGGGECTYSIAPTNLSFSAAGGDGQMTVDTQGGCDWTASSNAGWTTITSGNAGTGPGTVSYSVESNSGSDRTATIRAAGRNHTVHQSGCTYSITPGMRSFPTEGGTGSITVDTQEGCDWTASSNAGWAAITSGETGIGPGSVSYSVDPNTGAERAATILAAGENHTVDQAAIEGGGGGGDLDNGTFIAAASFAAGAAGSFFQTDVDVNNTDGDTVTYRFVWLPRGADNSSPLISQEFTLDAGESTRFENILAGVFALSEGVNGAVAVAADSEGLIVNSRTYNLPVVKVSGTFGQAIAGVPEEDLIEVNDIWRITFMSENADFRANLGCVNGRNESLRIFIDLYDPEGALLETKNMDLAPWSNKQINKIFDDYAPINGYADVRTTQADAAFWCYGSVLDNGSSDPTTVVPVKQ